MSTSTTNTANNTQTLLDQLLSHREKQKHTTAQVSSNTEYTNFGSELDHEGTNNSLECEENSCRGGTTWNGDENWASLGTVVLSSIMNLENKLISTSIRESCKLDAKHKTGGKRPRQPVRSTNPIYRIPSDTLAMWNSLYDEMRLQLNSCSPKEQSFYWNMVFNLIFYKRSIVKQGRGTIGCGERTISYWLIHRLIQDFPETVGEVIKLFPHFGY